MTLTLHWYVVFTKQQCEQKVEYALTRKGYQCYCPHHNIGEQWKNQDKPVQKPLFASFVFVYCTKEQFSEIKKTPGIINFLYRFSQPAIVNKEEIAAIVHAVSHYQDFQLLKTGLSKGSGEILQEPDSIICPLPSLGYTLIATKERSHAKAAMLTVTSQKRSSFRLAHRFRLAWR